MTMVLEVAASALIVAAVVVSAWHVCVRRLYREKRDHLRKLMETPTEDFRYEDKKENE